MTEDVAPGGWLHYLILFPALYLGIVTSIEDTRFGKIYRHHIRFGIVIGLVWLAALVVFHLFFLKDFGFLLQSLPHCLLAALIALVLSGGMWWFNVWSAADAKLFSVFTLLLPVPVIMAHHSPTLFSLTLMVNVYTVAFVLICADFILRFTSRGTGKLGLFFHAASAERRDILKSGIDYFRENVPGWIKTFIGIALILVLVRTLRRAVSDELQQVVTLDPTLLFLALFLAFRPLHMLFQIKAVAIVALLGFVTFLGYEWYLDPTGQRLLESASVGGWALGLILFRQVYSYWTSLVEQRRISLQDLREHLILATSTRSELQAQNVFSEEEMKQIGVEGLNAEQVLRIQQLYQDPEEQQQIAIENTIPFAPFIFGGYLATIYVGDVLLKLH